MAAPSAWAFYDDFHLRIGDSTFKLTTAPLTMALFLSTSNFATVSTSVYGSLTNEVANGNGYLTGGVAMTSITWTRSVGVAKLTAANTVWTGSGTGITGIRAAVIYANATLNGVVKPLVCYSILDSTPADLPTIPSGFTLTIPMNASGTFTLAG